MVWDVPNKRDGWTKFSPINKRDVTIIWHSGVRTKAINDRMSATAAQH